MTGTRDEWCRRLEPLSDGSVQRLGSGVEGAVYRLRPGTVAKVWVSKSAVELERMRRVYADVDAARPAVRTPLIHDILVLHGAAVTIERELPGVALQGSLDPAAEELPTAAVDAVIGCLLALRSVPPTEALRALPAVGENVPLRSVDDTFPSALVSLLDRRVRSSEPRLTSALPDFPRRFEALRARTAAIAAMPDTVVHGDLFGANIHVGADGEPVAMLDFGFMTTAGDPRFDAAVTAAIMNMRSGSILTW